jgi:hypothetical protein
VKALLGLLVGGIVGLIVAYAIALAAGSDNAPWFFLFVPVGMILGSRIAVSWGTVKRCPRCGEDVRREATMCRHCGYTFPEPVAR